MTNSLQGDVHSAIEAITGIPASFEGNLQALCTANGISAGEVSERLIALAKTADSTISTASGALNYFLQGGVSAVNLVSGSFYAPLTTSLNLSIGSGSATFTRASVATVMGYAPTANLADGQTLLTVASGEARFQGARRVSSGVWSNTFADGTAIPQSTLLGYLSEGAATNYAFPSGVGVSASTCTTAALTAASYTLSFKGTGSVTGTGGWVGTLAGTGASNRVSLTVTATVAAATLTVTGSVTEMQLELGTFATSLIATTAAAATRAADVLLYSSAGNIDLTQGTAYAELSTLWATSPSQLMAISTDNVGRILYGAAASSSTTIGMYDGVTTIQRYTLTDMNTGSRKRASSWGASGLRIGGDGATLVNGAFDGSMGATNQVAIGHRGGIGDFQWSGTIRNVRIWQTQLPDATLQAITS